MPGTSVRSAFRQRLLAAIILLAVCAPSASVLAQDAHKQVLVLYSTRRDSQFAIVGETELPRTLDVGLGRNLDYYSEFIDVARFPDVAYKEAFANFLRQKYQGLRFDLVIALHDAAIEFVNENRDTLFRDMPQVFMANDPAFERRPNSTGLIHRRDFKGTLTLMRELQPDVKNVFVVAGAAAADKIFEDAARTQLQSFESQLTLTYLSGLATQDLEQRLSTLPARSAVYYLLVTEDGQGNRFHPLEYVDRIAAAANAPTYCWVDSAMDHGIVGGSLYNQVGAIERVGQLALRVLRGEPADSIRVSVPDLNAKQVDWRQLRRWGIDEARVPEGTRVLFRDPTVWDRYKRYIVAAFVVLLTQTVLIAGLLIQRRRRRQAEGQLRGSQNELRKSYERNRDLAARLLEAQETERSRIARELHDDICQRMLLLTIELESLEGAKHKESPAAEAVMVAQGISKSLHELSHRLHPARLRLIGLVAALDRLRLEVSRGGIPVSFAHENVPSSLSPDLMLCLFRVVQEALQNAIKYSKATQVSVQLIGSPPGLTLTITDNGIGFDVDAAWHKGLGLVSMAERLEAIGGSLEVRSKPGEGTRLTVSVPIQLEESVNTSPSLAELQASP